MSELPSLLLVGGGLANTLIAYRLATTRPEIRFLLLERGRTLGGDHTWSFHAGDLAAAQHRWLSPFVEHRWADYEVRFPRYTRTIDSGYLSFGSPRLHDVAMATFGDRVRLGVDVVAVDARGATLAGGERVAAHAVADGRGAVTSPHLTLRFQKFVGKVLRTAAPHRVNRPIIMDATVAQTDGYRFVYTLPYTESTALVEDTYYSDSPVLTDAGSTATVDDYLRIRDWPAATCEREERGVLPIVLAGDIHRFWKDGAPEVARTGLAGALFHPTTGYSLPDAVRTADRIAGWMPIDGPTLHHRVRAVSVALWKRNGFFRALNRMLFLAGESSARFRVLERFYRLPEPLIGRFYAGAPTLADRARLLCGRPPVPVAGAVRALLASGAVPGNPA